MVIDRLRNAAGYYGLGRRLQAAFEYLQRNELHRRELGRYEINGGSVYALVQQYSTKPREQGRLEAHRRYMDVQYLLEGAERIGYANLESLRVVQPYDEAKDVLFCEGEADLLLLRAGSFALFGPQDAHMPGLLVAAPQTVKKVVVKVMVG